MTKIKILASDIMETGYYNPNDCPITRALRRAGFYNYKDCGTDIIDNERNTIVSNQKHEDKYSKEYRDLYERVDSMYCYKNKQKGNILPAEEPKDFEVELPI